MTNQISRVVDANDWAPEQFIHHIDWLFTYCKQRRLGRLSEEWSKGSREMNLSLREKINSTSAHARYQYTGLYWVAKSQILEMYHKSRRLRVGKRKKLEADARNYKRIALGEE